jgi:hypothetical protein
MNGFLVKYGQGQGCNNLKVQAQGSEQKMYVPKLRHFDLCCYFVDFQHADFFHLILPSSWTKTRMQQSELR